MSDSPYGTFDQGGNVWEWNETVLFSSSRGGSFFNGSLSLLASARPYSDPSFEGLNVGFRVASIPEPASNTLWLAGAMTLMLWRRRK